MNYVEIRAPARILLGIASIPFWIGFVVAMAPLYYGEAIEFDVALLFFLTIPFVFTGIAISGKAPWFG